MSYSAHAQQGDGRAYWVSVALAALAVLFSITPLEFENPAKEPEVVPSAVTSSTPVRRPSGEAEYELGGFTYRCSECHRGQPEPYVVGHDFTKHAEIELAHGINTRCLNCHHPTNREKFVDYFGEEIPWDQPQLLCAQCHGPVYRDWQHGAHGRVNGYWDESRGDQQRLKCIECHDPHHPPFPPLPTTPGPRTLRSSPHDGDHHEREYNPLRVMVNDSTTGSTGADHMDQPHE